MGRYGVTGKVKFGSPYLLKITLKSRAQGCRRENNCQYRSISSIMLLQLGPYFTQQFACIFRPQVDTSAEQSSPWGKCTCHRGRDHLQYIDTEEEMHYGYSVVSCLFSSNAALLMIISLWRVYKTRILPSMYCGREIPPLWQGSLATSYLLS